MTYLKMIGLAAVAALALAALGASTASADVLCKVAVNTAGECPTTEKGAAQDYAASTVFTAESINPKLTVFGSFVATSITCEKSNVTLENTSTGSNTAGTGVAGKVTDVTFTGNCKTNGGTACTVSTSNGYTGEIKATSELVNNVVTHTGDGALTVKGGTATLVECGFEFFKCKYTVPAAGLNLGLTHGNPAKVSASEQELTLAEKFFGCGTSAKWDADYTMTGTNTALWVATKNA
jgi:hypothetical protein